MKILHISDTHGSHRMLRDLPEADVLVHSGDFTMFGTEQEAYDFMQWLCELNYPEKVFICGNHDCCMYSAQISGLDSNVHYLCNSSALIAGMKFYGVPMFIEDCHSGRIKRNYARIPLDTDILVTHSPAYGILDEDAGINFGSAELLKRLSQVNPRLHLFGHVHPRHGRVQNGTTLFSNGSLTNDDYALAEKPYVIEI